jgi:hypothetical protein
MYTSLRLPPPPSNPHDVSGPSTPAHKHRRTFSDGAHRCRRRVVLGVAATDVGAPRLHAEVEGMLRLPPNRSAFPSVAPCDSNDEDPLPTLEIRLYIAIEVVYHLKMAQEIMLLLVEELSLVDFLLGQILSLKEVVAQHGGVVPHIITLLPGHKQVTLPMDMTIFDHQLLVSSDCKLANAKTYAGRKLALIARCRSRHAPICPSLALGRVIGRKGWSASPGELPIV